MLGGERATLIKMDIEGSELAALKGAKETIQQYQYGSCNLYIS